MMIYGGGAWSYAHDPNFTHVSTSVKFWEKIIDKYYTKYHGIAQGHDKDIKFAQQHGYLEAFTGQFWKFSPVLRNGEYKWPLTTIKNYPIQGTGATLVKLARIEAFRRFTEEIDEGEFISTVHDDLKFDVPSKYITPVATILRESIAKVPEMCYNIWSYKFSLPLKCEVFSGPNFYDLKELT